MNKKIENFIKGEFKSSKSDSISVMNPQDGKIFTKVVNSSLQELNKAVDSAKNAFINWIKCNKVNCFTNQAINVCICTP